MVPKHIKKRLNPARVYSKIIIFFVVITIILTVVVVNFSLTKAKIIVTPAEKVVSSDFIVELRQGELTADNSAEGYLSGQIFDKEVEGSGIYDTESTKLVESDNLGQVTIYNNNTVSQTLVATTQLQTSDGIIVRTKDKVTIPAKSEASVSVYADAPEKITGGLIPAKTKLTIIKLGASLQPLIYGINANDLVVGGTSVKVAREEDFARAQNNLVDKLTGEAILDFKKNISTTGDNLAEVIDKKVVNFTSKQKVGDESETVEGALKLKIVAAVFDKEQLLKLARIKLSANLSPDEELFKTNDESLYFAINNYDSDKKIIFLNVTLAGTSGLKANSDLLAANKFMGMTAEEVNDYLIAFDSVKNVRVEFFPFWVKRAPKLEDRVEVVLMK